MDNEEFDGVKFSAFPSQTPGNSDEVVGLHSGDNARFSIANIVAAVRNGLASIFVPLTRTINGKGLSTDITLDASDVGAVDTADVGVADGVASLDSTGKVPGTQLDLSGKQPTIIAYGILKGDGAGGVSAATAGTDYQAPLTAGTDYATPAQLADKAAKSDLTSIHATGTTNTTGAAIPAGAYFYLNGTLYQAKTQIDVNATFTVNTNCEAVAAGLANEVIQQTVDAATGTVNPNITERVLGNLTKIGKTATVNIIIEIKPGATVTTNEFYTLPAGFRPKNTLYCGGILGENPFTIFMAIRTDGQIIQSHWSSRYFSSYQWIVLNATFQTE